MTNDHTDIKLTGVIEQLKRLVRLIQRIDRKLDLLIGRQDDDQPANKGRGEP